MSDAVNVLVQSLVEATVAVLLFAMGSGLLLPWLIHLYEDISFRKRRGK